MTLQVAMAVASLKAGDQAVLDAILTVGLEGEEPMISGEVYERLGGRARMSYTLFHKRLRKQEFLRMVDLAVLRRKGATRFRQVHRGRR